MKSTSPLFTVIIPAFNRAKLLQKAIGSVLAQTYSDFELIVVDDGSTDHTKDVVHRYDDERLRYIYQENSGPSSARNKGIQLARGELVAFLDSDDWWDKNKLLINCAYIEQYPDINFFHTQEVWYRNGVKLNQKIKHENPDGYVYPKALEICNISISTAVVARDVFASIGLFDETMPACEDYDLWLRITHKYKVKLIPQELTFKEGGRADQITSRLWGLDRYRMKALAKMLDSGELSREEYQMTFAQLQKKATIYIQGMKKRGKAQEAEEYLELIERCRKSPAHV